jgi:hypothetical protein
MTDNVIYRFLERADKDQYREIIEGHKNFMGFKKDSVINEYLLNLFDVKINSSDNKIAGVFVNGELVNSLGGYYPNYSLTWYATNHLSKTIGSGINYKVNNIYFLELLKMLIIYGEDNGFYNFYSRRPLRHQKTIEKIIDMHVSKDEVRYDVYYDMVYPANANCKCNAHSFYFAGHFKTLPIDTVIMYHTLAQRYRLQIFNKDEII